MKRIPNHSKPYYKIKAIKPLFFWRQCDICDKEFRREEGWEITYWGRRFEHKAYACKECCPTIKDAQTIRDKYNRL